jgi:hypothetical protein
MGVEVHLRLAVVLEGDKPKNGESNQVGMRPFPSKGSESPLYLQQGPMKEGGGEETRTALQVWLEQN